MHFRNVLGLARIRVQPSVGMGAKSFHLHVNLDDTIGHLKKTIRNTIANSETPFPQVAGMFANSAPMTPLPFALMYNGKVLKNHRTLADYNIGHGDSISIRPMNWMKENFA